MSKENTEYILLQYTFRYMYSDDYTNVGANVGFDINIETYVTALNTYF